MEVKPGSSIYLFDNVISDDFMKDLKIIIDNTDGRKEVHGPGSNVQGKIVMGGDFKNQDFAKVIDDKLQKIVIEIVLKMRNINPYIISNGDSGYQFRRIEGATRLHTDDITGLLEVPKLIESNTIRWASLIIALNEDYDGGEFLFPHHDVKFKLKKGQAVLFPPYWTHPHCTSELLNDTMRYTINTWLTQ